jgi:hypothetical protein
VAAFNPLDPSFAATLSGLRNDEERAAAFRLQQAAEDRRTAIKSLRIDTALSFGGKLWYP